MKKALFEYINDHKTRRDIDSETSEICDLETGECQIVKLKDGFIEREENHHLGKKIQIETVTGIKQLLID